MLNNLLLATIALGIWANVVVTLGQPIESMTDKWLRSIASDTASINAHFQVLLSGRPQCHNKKICD